MKKFVFKSSLYVILILITLEAIVRVFHLTKDYPTRYVDKFGVEKWMPDQEGYSVTGIRIQNFSKFHINDFGFNSYREFKPSKDKAEIALVGDSFIEGFHQNYYNSLGKKIENQLNGIEVYEYGYAGYDLADELHLIHQYKNQFDLIDYVIIGLRFDDDLTRDAYHVIQDRMRLQSPLYKAIRNIKLLVYLQTIGAFDGPREFINKILAVISKPNGDPKIHSHEDALQIRKDLEQTYINNFKTLITTYGYDKTRFTFLLDASITSPEFLNYLQENHFKYIDFSETLKTSKMPSTLIYDQHWNNHGRTLIAQLIAHYIHSESNQVK